MLAPGEFPVPMPTVLAGWWGDKFNRLFLNNVAMPKLKSVNATVDLLPARRVATIETAWTPTTEVEAGTEIPVKVFLRPYRGERIERSLTVKIPAGMPKGEHRLLFSDADTLDRSQDGAAQNNNNMDIPSTVSLLNQERDNNRLYVSLVQSRADVLRRRQDAAQPAVVGGERHADRAERQPVAWWARRTAPKCSSRFRSIKW